jgi:hypothetical protein
MPLSDDDIRRVREVAELEVRRYFDHYLLAVFPVQIKAVIEQHNSSKESHGAVERRFNKVLWIATGLASAGGLGAGVGLKQLVSLVAG